MKGVNPLLQDEEYDDDGEFFRQGDACPECGCYALDITTPAPPEYLQTDEELDRWDEDQEEVATCHCCGWSSAG